MSFVGRSRCSRLLAVPLAVGRLRLLERRREPAAASRRRRSCRTSSAEPGWLRHLPLALALLALAALVTGLARRTRPSPCRRSRLRSCSRSTPRARWSRLTCRRAGSRSRSRPCAASWQGCLEGYRVGMVSFAQSAQTRPARDGEPRRCAQAALKASAPATAPPSARGSPGDPGRAAGAGRGGQEAAGLDPRPLRRRADAGRARAAQAAAARAKKLKIPVYTVAFGTTEGVVEVVDDNGFTQRVTVPPDPPTLRQVSQVDRRPLLRRPRRRELNAVYEELGSRIGSVKKEREVTAAFAAGGAVAPARGRERSRPSSSGGCREAPRFFARARRRRRPSPPCAVRASAGTECDGLIVCIPVQGPWVQVPGSGDADLLPALLPAAAARSSAASTPTAPARSSSASSARSAGLSAPA